MRSSTRGYSRTGRVVVDDTGAILAGLPLSLPLKQYTTPLVIKEVKDRESRSVLEKGLELGRLEVMSPPEAFLEMAKRVARSAGTLGRLSETDLEIVALALYLREEGYEVHVATDDYAIQHTLLREGFHIIRIRYRGVRA